MISNFGNEPSYNLFVDGQYFGPFNESLIVEEINNHRVGSDLMVWNENLPEWTPIGETQSFISYKPLFVEKTNLSQDLTTRQQELMESMRLKRLAFIDNKRDEFSEKNKEEIQREPVPQTETEPESTVIEHEVTEISDTPFVTLTEKPNPTKIWTKRGALATLAALLIFGLWSLYSHIQFERNYETILSQVDASYSDINHAKKFLKSQTNEKALIFLEKTTTGKAPQLRLFAHWPDQSRILLTLTGIRKTLVGAIHQQIESEVFLSQSTGSSKPIISGNKSLHPGFYKVSFKCINCTGEEAQRIELSKPLAIGMADKVAYSKQLKEFHTLLKRQAESELIELNEIIFLLKERVYSAKSKNSRMQKQLSQVLKSITSDVAQSSYVFGQTYIQLKDYLTSMKEMSLKDRKNQLDKIKKEVSSLSKTVKNGSFLN